MVSYSQLSRVFWTIMLVPWCSLAGCAPPAPGAGSPESLAVTRGALVRRHLLTGEIEAVETSRIKVPQTRDHRLLIERIVADGSTVAEGDTVLEFDNSSFTANLDQQRTAVQRSQRTLLQVRAAGEARLREAEAAVERARIALAKAELDASVPASVRSRYEHRTFELALTKAAANHDKALADLRSAATSVEAETRVAEEQHSKAARELAVAEETLASLVLKAPRSGIVVVDQNPWEDRKFQVGDTAFPGWTVLGIPDLGRLRVRATLSDVDDGALEIGLPARCTPDIEPRLVLDGVITEITPIAREQRIFSERRGFDVTVDLPGASPPVLLVPGMSVRVEVDQVSPSSLLIPRASLDLSHQPPRALLDDGSWAEVELGECSATRCILLGGLDEGSALRSLAGWSP
ncbi:MAG: hypothetical protein MUC56_12705 [Thermoanaerobaculales bacterium]|nr:hypothetical protein [Thermoanaerobaculales bacterium]